MKWDKLRLVGATNVDLPVLGADPSGPFILKGVDGLDPPPVDVAFARARGQRGVRQKRTPQYRQIVAEIGLQPDYNTGQTSADLRNTLYGLLTPKYDQMVKAQIMLGTSVIAEAQGDISNLEASIFTKDPEVQASLDCDSAYLIAPTAINQLPTRSIVSGQTALDITNPGDAPTGFYIRFTLQETLSGSLRLSEDSAFGRTIEISGPHAAGDTILIDTRPGQRKVSRIPSGQSGEVSILNNVVEGSPWLMLHGGANRLLLNATLFDWYSQGFTHTPMYWGV